LIQLVFNCQLLNYPSLVSSSKKKQKEVNKKTKTPKTKTAESNQNDSSDSSGLNITVNETHNATMQSPLAKPANSSGNGNNQVSTPNTQPCTKKLAHIDLSIVKQEALDSGNEDSTGNVHLKNVNLNSNGEINSQNNYSLNSSFKIKTNGKWFI
jgi:hypothetical protein